MEEEEQEEEEGKKRRRECLEERKKIKCGLECNFDSILIYTTIGCPKVKFRGCSKMKGPMFMIYGVVKNTVPYLVTNITCKNKQGFLLHDAI